jgi:hypothetical protein
MGDRLAARQSSTLAVMGASANEFETKFVDFLNDRYGDGPGWSDPEFHCYSELAPELRYLVAMSRLEQDTADGSLAQAFWNSSPNHMVLLSLCEEGYRMVGASRHSEALPRVKELFQGWVDEAAPYIRRAIAGDESAFGEWCGIRFASSDTELDKLFCLSEDADSAWSIRADWIEQHVQSLEEHLVKAKKRKWAFWRR